MKLLAAFALITLPWLGACAGGPLTTDAELSYALEENAAADQAFAADADAGIMEATRILEDAFVAFAAWAAGQASDPLPPELAGKLDRAGVVFAGYVPKTPASPPDPADKPTDDGWSFDLGQTVQLGVTAIVGAIMAYVGVEKRRGPPEKVRRQQSSQTTKPKE